MENSLDSHQRCLFLLSVLGRWPAIATLIVMLCTDLIFHVELINGKKKACSCWGGKKLIAIYLLF